MFCALTPFRPMRFAVLVCSLLLATPLASLAQTQDDEPVLPEITPREIEIRGEYSVVFPSLERPMLDELQPRTNVQALPLDGLPPATPFTFQIDALPPLDLDPPDFSRDLAGMPESPLDGINGFLEASGGRFTERLAHAHFQLPLSRTTHINLDAEYEGMRGSSPFEESVLRTTYNVFDGALDLEHRGGSWGWRSAIDGAYTDRSLYGLANVSAFESPARTSTQVGTHHTLDIYGNVPVTFSAGYEAHTATFDADNDTAPGTGLPTPGESRTTQQFTSQLNVTFPLNIFDLRLDGRTTLAGLNGEPAFAADARSGLLHTTAHLVDSPDVHVEAGFTFMNVAVDAPYAFSASSSLSNTYGAPYAHVKWHPTPGWTVYADQTPTLTLHTPSTLFDTNPYTITDPGAGATVHTLNTTAGLIWTPGPLTLDLHAGIQRSPQRMFFAFDDGLYAPNSFESDTRHIGFDATLQAVSPWFGTLHVQYTDGSIEQADGLPLVARARGEATVGYQFADRQARIQLHMHGQGPRDLDNDGTTTVPGFVALGLSGDVQITPNLEVTGYVKDLGSNEVQEWPGYPQPTARIGGGVRLLW